MAAVRIVRDPIASDTAAEVPKAQWDVLMEARHLFCTKYLPKDCRNLLFFVEDGASNAWVGYGSYEEYIRAGLGLDPTVVDWAIAGLRRMQPGEPVGFEAAVRLGQREIGVEGGKPGPGRGHKTGDDVTRFPGERGNSAAYILARLERDGFTELADRVRDKAVSARAAARIVGWQHDKTPLEKLVDAWEKTSADDRASFLARVIQ